MQAMLRLLIIGCGDVVSRELPWLTRRFRVYAAIRRQEEASRLRALGITPLLADLDQQASLKRLTGLADILLHSAPPQENGETDQRTRRLLATLSRGGSLPRRLVYLSTTGVYGDCGGAAIDETRRAAPRSPRGKRRLDAERQLRAWGARHGVRVALLRAPGIYAADRLPLDRLRRGDPVLKDDEDVFTNHIHAADLARMAALALFRARAGRTWNTVDDSCLKMGDWYDQLADSFALPRPPRVSRAEAAQRLSPMTLSFMAESRRIGNARIKRELRYRYLYPNVAAGLAAAIQAKSL